MTKERRRAPRTRKRIRVEYGQRNLEHVGFTKDVSVGGLFLASTKAIAPGTRLHLRLSWGDEAFVAEGVVTRQHQVHPTLRQVDTGGIGIRFLRPDELVRDLVPSGLRAPIRHVVECRDDAELRQIVREQIARGVLLVPAGPSDTEPGATIELEVRVGEGSAVQGHGVVLQRLEQGYAGAPALLVELRDSAMVDQLRLLAAS